MTPLWHQPAASLTGTSSTRKSMSKELVLNFFYWHKQKVNVLRRVSDNDADIICNQAALEEATACTDVSDYRNSPHTHCFQTLLTLMAVFIAWYESHINNKPGWYSVFAHACLLIKTVSESMWHTHTYYTPIITDISYHACGANTDTQWSEWMGTSHMLCLLSEEQNQ